MAIRKLLTKEMSGMQFDCCHYIFIPFNSLHLLSFQAWSVSPNAQQMSTNSFVIAGPICQLEKTFVVLSARKTTTDDHSTNQSACLIVENHISNDNHPEISLAGHSLGQRETVKHMVYQNCRTSMVSGCSLHHLNRVISVFLIYERRLNARS